MGDIFSQESISILTNSTIQKLSWMAKSAHIQLLLMAYDNKKNTGYLVNDKETLRLILINNHQHIEAPLWDEIYAELTKEAWQQCRLQNKPYIFNKELLAAINKEKGIRDIKTVRKGKKIVFDDSLYDGYNLKQVLRSNPFNTILYRKPSEVITDNIRDFTINFLVKAGMTEGKAATTLNLLIKTHGAIPTYNAVAQISSYRKYPDDIFLALSGLASKSTKFEKQGKQVRNNRVFSL